MADQGPLLTSCIIFYLSIGAAIFQILEESNWELARSKYDFQKEQVLKKYPCLRKEDLDEILEVVSDAAGRGVVINGDNHRNMWDWGNSVIFAATIVTTIGYGNVAPKTKGGRVFCILYGLCGIPLCLVWISKLGSFFGDRAKRLSQILIRKNVPVKRVQLICTVIFLLWGLFVHLVIPPLLFMSLEGWSYLEGFYFSFITLTTVGFGDYVAGVNPNIEYPRLYRVFVEIWIYMGLAWLSLFFGWNVNMVVEAHKVLKKRRHKRRPFQDDEPQPEEDTPKSDTPRPSVIDIFSFLSDKEEDYSTVIKEIGMAAKPSSIDVFSRSKSCSDILTTNIEMLDHSPRHRCLMSISEVFMNPKNNDCQEKENQSLLQEDSTTGEPAECAGTDETLKEVNGTNDSPNVGMSFTVPAVGRIQEENAQPSNGVTRFTISKVQEEDALLNKDENG
ncbi:potassium channel subfamily K member 5-like isoform X1 [Phycodurus eques]|uniref:potassium channel subfamily K member 5-like isoform X1 n=1 Tax=Phycodurus eques TaxID=693459 RepID=UPI002ACE4D25|nr:potassium channel subfamily K member 5-like isoform X1 [Phycodurus eques]